MAGKAYAGFFGLPEGMNSGIDSKLIKDTAYARGNNVSVRGGFVETRGGFVQEYTFVTEGNCRGAGVWRLNSGDYIVAVIGNTVEIYSVETKVNYIFSPYLVSGTQCFMEQIDRWFCIQDGASRPIVFALDATDVPVVYGTTSPLVCYPVSTIMKYAHGRTHMVPLITPAGTPDPDVSPDVIPDDSSPAENGRTLFVSSDIRDNLNPEYVFRMGEHRAVSGGGAITLPLEAGFIGGMGLLRSAPTGTGVGPLVILGRDGVSAFDIAVPRSQWFSTGGLGQVLFRHSGTRSPWSVVELGDDLAYIDGTGNVRTLRYDVSALSGGALTNRPMSNEMRYFVETQSMLYLNRVSAAAWDNRFAWTMHGDADYRYKGIGVLDVSILYSLTASGEPPAYYGIWTGFSVYQVLQARWSNVERLYCVAKTANGFCALLRNDDTAATDPNDTPILSTIVTGAYSLATDGVATTTDVKRLDYADLWLSNIKRDTELQLYYRPNGYEAWTLMGSKTIHVPGGPAQYRRQVRISLDQSQAACNHVDMKPLNVSDRFQFMIRWRGWCRIEAFRPIASRVSEEDPDICAEDNSEGAELPVDTLDPDFDYEVTL